MNQWKSAHANTEHLRNLYRAMVGGCLFGVSRRALSPRNGCQHGPKPSIFAMANPDPEITPEEAQQ